MEKEELQKLKKFMKLLKYEFNNPEILKKALIHRSYLNEAPNAFSLKHNERLEFLGDAVLELVVTKYLFNAFENTPEGDLTSFRAALVRTESLAETASILNFGEYIYMSKGEEATGGRERPYILANTFEAILGAIYEDADFETCEKFVLETLIPKLQKIVENRLDIDPKSALQEVAQEIFKFTPIYELVSAKGPDHDRTFTVEVVIKEKNYGQGTGKSKQAAEQEAAAAALAKISENRGK